MANRNPIFKQWIPQRIIPFLLIIALFPHIMLLSLFSLNSTFTASFLDVEVEDIQFLFSIAYATIVCGLFMHVRFFQYFNIRSFVLLMTILNIVVLIFISFTRNIHLIHMLRIIQGPLALFEGCIMLPIIIASIKSQHAKLIAYSALYAWMLTGDKFATSLVKFALDNYSQQMIYFVVIAYHILALLLFVVLLNPKRLFPKKPLYQLNIGGVGLMIISLISGAFFLIYGKKLYWFESPQIVSAFTLCLVTSALFLWREKYNNRPLFHFEIFKSKRVLTGLVFFFFFYIMRASMSNIYQVMGQVWNWPWEFVLKIQYCNVAGSIIGVFSAYYLLKNRVNYYYIFFIGFAVIASSMFFFSTLFYFDTRVELIGSALFLEGIGQGILFCPLVFYMLNAVDPSIARSVAQGGTAVRFWTNTIGFSLMQNLMLHLTTKHQHLLTKNLDITHTVFQEEWSKLYAKFSTTYITNDAVRLSAASIHSKLYKQAILVSNIEVFRTLFLLALLLASFILIYSFFRKRLNFIN